MKIAKILKPGTQQVTEIPVAELAPGMIPVRMDDSGSTVWVDESQVVSGTMRHPPFAAATRKIIRQLHDDLADVCPQTVEQWELGFRHDEHPEMEINLWQCIASACKRLLSTVSDPNPGRKHDYLQLLLGWVSTGDKEAVLATVELVEISRQEAGQILNQLPSLRIEADSDKAPAVKYAARPAKRAHLPARVKQLLREARVCPMQGRAFANVGRTVLHSNQPSLLYAEGYVRPLKKNYAIAHAWLVLNGQDVEITLPQPPEILSRKTYSAQEMGAALAPRGLWCPIDKEMEKRPSYRLPN